MLHHILQNIFHAIIPVAHAADESAAAAGPVQMFGLDWKHFLAQLVNFLIIFWLLARYIFKPLTKKLEERTAKIEKSLADAKKADQALRAAEETKRAEIEKGRLEAQEIITKAQKTAEQSANQILAEARASGEKLIEQTRKELQNEKEKLLVEVKEEAATLIVTATERIIREKLDAKKDEQLIKDHLKFASLSLEEKKKEMARKMQ